MSFGSRFKYFRNHNKLTQQVLAKGICSVSYLSKIENGAIEPNVELLDLLCSRLGISLDQLADEQQQIPKLIIELESLYRLIRNKEVDEASNLFSELTERYNDITVPQAVVLVGMFGLRVSLLESNNKQSADAYYKEISTLLPYVDTSHLSYYYRFRGLYQYLYGSIEKALEYYKLAEHCIQNNEIEEVYYQLSLVYTRLQSVSLSTLYLTKALEIFVQKMDYELCTNCYLLLGVNYRIMGEFEKAISNYQSLLQRLRSPDDDIILSKVYHNLGLIYSDLGDCTLAVNYFVNSLKLKKEQKSKIKTIYLLTKEYFKQNNKDQTAKLLQEGKLLSSEFQNEDYHIKFSVLEYLVFNMEQSVEFENHLINIAIPNFKTKGELDTVSEYIKLLAVYYEEQRQYKKAYELLKNLLNEVVSKVL